MKCILLAAGYATRLYPLTKDFPKPLLPVGGRPILDWLIADIESEIEEFIVVSNHRFAPIFEKWREERGGRLTVLDDGTESNETRLGAVKDIRFALRERNVADDVLVMAGDNLLDFSLRGFLAFCREKNTSCVMCHPETRLEALRKTAVITVDENGRVTSYAEKPAEPRGQLAVPPFYFYKAADAARIDEALAAGCGFDAPGSFAAWLSARVPLHAFSMPGRRYDIGDLRSYEAAQKIFADA